jgi:hypothetical protein
VSPALRDRRDTRRAAALSRRLGFPQHAQGRRFVHQPRRERCCSGHRVKTGELPAAGRRRRVIGTWKIRGRFQASHRATPTEWSRARASCSALPHRPSTGRGGGALITQDSCADVGLRPRAGGGGGQLVWLAYRSGRRGGAAVLGGAGDDGRGPAEAGAQGCTAALAVISAIACSRVWRC